jgi:hypothetical protein
MQQSELVEISTEEQFELSNDAVNGTANKALAGALHRLAERAKTLHNSHHTKHSSYSTKHSSW